MFQVNATGTPRTVIDQLNKQEGSRSGSDKEEGLRTKVIGLAKDALAGQDPGATVAVQASVTNHGDKVQSLNLSIQSSSSD